MSKNRVNFNCTEGYPEVYHDHAVYFISKMEPEKNEDLTLRLRAKKGDITSAFLSLMTVADGNIKDYPMSNIGSAFDKTGRYEFYEVTINVGEGGFCYCFGITSAADGKLYYYTQLSDHLPIGEVKMKNEQPMTYPDVEQNGWFFLPGYKGSAWSQGITWYSIMPDAFYNGDPTNDDTQSDENYDIPWNLHHFGLRDRYGGDFQGIMDNADYFLDLGVDGVFYDPIQKAEQNAGYGTDDFDQLESTFCNADKYSEFIEYMHGKGLRLMQDVVVYFTTFEGMYINRSDRWPTPKLDAKKGETHLNKESPYYNLFCDADNGGHPMWNGFTINHYDPAAAELLYGAPETCLIRYADKSQGFGVDGYRYDCGGWITGHEGTSDDYPFETEDQRKGRHYNYRTDHVMPPMYNKVRAVNPEFNTLSESSGGHQFRGGYWDSHWLIGLNKQFESFLDPAHGNSCNNVYHAMFHNTFKTKPRSGALCSKIQVNTHDESKNNMRPEKYAAWKAARLIQMTFIGSPSIYYGEEHNFGGTNYKNRYGGNRNGFSFFDWDESRWDHKMRNFFKAVIELRKEYSAIRTGAFVHLGHNDDCIDYARFDENGTVVTLTNQTDNVMSHTVNAAAAGLTDGTVLTDWLTGEKFTVKDNELSLDVIPGGRVLVCGGKKTSSFRLGFMADGDCTGDISNETEKSVSVKNTGFEKFYLVPAFASFKYNVKIEGNGIATIRNCTCFGAMNYEAEVKGNTLTVSANGEVVTTAKTDGNITLYRKADNTFGVEGVNDSEVKIPMDDKVYVGFGVRNADAKFTLSDATAFEARPLADNFDSIPTALLRNPDELKTENGYLVMPANTSFTTRCTDDDWTFKAKLSYTPKQEGDYAGVISKQDDKNKVIAGRIFEDGKVYLFAAKTSGGELVITEKQLDTNPEKEIILQLQRLGTGYTAVYSYDGEFWYALGGNIFMNLCRELPGVEVVGNESAKVDFVSYGDAIKDGNSFFTPFTPNLADNIMPYTEEKNSFKLRLTEGNWVKAPEGYRNPEISDAQMSIVNKTYKDFRAEASFNILDGNGWAGFAFGKSSVEAAVNSAYSLRLDNKNNISLCKGNVVICSVPAPKSYMQVRLVLEVKGTRAVVYSGRDAKPVMQTNLLGYTEGYFSFATGNTAANVGNFNICEDNAAFSTNFIWNYKVENNNVVATGDGNVAVFLRGCALTDYALTTTVKLNKYHRNWASAGLLLSNMTGIDSSHERVGLYLSVSDTGAVRLEDKGETICGPYQLTNPEVPTKLTVVKQGKKYTIYVGNSATPVFEYEEPVLMGSVYSLESHASNTVFSDIAIRNLPKGTDPLKLDICRHLK